MIHKITITCKKHCILNVIVLHANFPLTCAVFLINHGHETNSHLTRECSQGNLVFLLCKYNSDKHKFAYRGTTSFNELPTNMASRSVLLGNCILTFSVVCMYILCILLINITVVCMYILRILLINIIFVLFRIVSISTVIFSLECILKRCVVV